MKEKLILVAALFLAALLSHAQSQIKVSTGLNAALTGAESIGNFDPYWKIASSPNPPGTLPKVCNAYLPFWQATPLTGTNAGWINVAGSATGSNLPGIYVFERDVAIPASTASFSCNFGVAYDDALVSLELVSPSAATTALTVVPTTAYWLSAPVTTTITAPLAGVWRIRATINFIDAVGAFMLSGDINTLPGRCSFVQALDSMGGTAPGIFDHPAGGFFATGLLKDSTVIIKADGSGNISWIQKFKLGSGFYQVKDLKVDAAGDLFGIANKQNGGYQSMIFKCNATATSFSWTKDNKAILYAQLHLLNAADFIVTGTNNGGFTHLERRSKAAGSISGYNWQGEGGDYFSTLSGNNLYGTCRRYYNAAGDFRVGLFSHNPGTGAFVWQNAIISRGNTSIATQTRMYPVAPAVDNSSLLVLASGDLVGFDAYNTGPVEMVMAKTNLLGNVTWTRQYITTGYDRPVSQVVRNTNTGYYIVATLFSTTLNDFAYTLVIKTDKTGNVVWARRLGFSGKNIATTAVEKSGKLYLAMASDSYAPNQLVLVKLDANGNSSQRCAFIQPITVTSILLPNVQDVRNYPVAVKALAEANLLTPPASVAPLSRFWCETDCRNDTITAKPVLQSSMPLGRAQSITLVPNPAGDVVTVVLSGTCSAQAVVLLTDLAGTNLQQWVLPAGSLKKELQLRGMLPGTYQVMVYEAGRRVAAALLSKQ